MNSHKQKRYSPRSSKCIWIAKLWLVCTFGMCFGLPVALVSAHAVEVSPPKPSPPVTQDVQHKTFESLYQALLEKFNVAYDEAYIKQQIKWAYENPGLVDGEFQKRSTQLGFISHVGLNHLKAFADVTHEKFLRWLFHEVDAMDQFLASGAPREHNYVQALTIWKKIWTKDPDSQKGLYLRLAIAVALEHASSLDTSWYKRSAENQPILLDAVSRYENFKKAHLAKKLSPVFEKLDVPQMRMVVNALATDADLDWVRETYSTTRKLVSSYSHETTYSHNTMAQAGEELRSFQTLRQSKLPNKSVLEQFGVQATLKKVLETGIGCGTQANYATVVAQAHGIPAIAQSQPNYTTVLFYNRDQLWETYYYVGQQCQLASQNNRYIPWSPLSGKEEDFPEYLRLYEDAKRNYAQKLVLTERFRHLANFLTDKSVAQRVRALSLTQTVHSVQIWRDLVSNLDKKENPNLGEFVYPLYLLDEMLLTFHLSYPHVFEELYPLIEANINSQPQSKE